MKIDMSPDAITERLETLDQLWELTVELQTAKITDEWPEPKKEDDGKSPE